MGVTDGFFICLRRVIAAMGRGGDSSESDACGGAAGDRRDWRGDPYGVCGVGRHRSVLDVTNDTVMEAISWLEEKKVRFDNRG